LLDFKHVMMRQAQYQVSNLLRANPRSWVSRVERRPLRRSIRRGLANAGPSFLLDLLWRWSIRDYLGKKDAVRFDQTALAKLEPANGKLCLYQKLARSVTSTQLDTIGSTLLSICREPRVCSDLQYNIWIFQAPPSRTLIVTMYPSLRRAGREVCFFFLHRAPFRDGAYAMPIAYA
jgi:hypothetical protein